MAMVSKLARKEHLGNRAAECGSLQGLECWSIGVLECCKQAFQRRWEIRFASIRIHSRSKLLAFLLCLIAPSAADAWWNGDWSIRKKITVDTSASGVAIN